MKACSEQACKTDSLAGSSDQACLFTTSWLLVWAVAMRSTAKFIGKPTVITETLQVTDKHFTSSVELVRARANKQ